MFLCAIETRKWLQQAHDDNNYTKVIIAQRTVLLIPCFSSLKMQNLGQTDYFAALTVSELFPFKDVCAIPAHLRALGSEEHKDDLPKLHVSSAYLLLAEGFSSTV